MLSCVRRRSRRGRPKKSAKRLCKRSKKRSGRKRSGRKRSSKKRSGRRLKKGQCPKTKMESCTRHSLSSLKRVGSYKGISGSTKQILCKKLIKKGSWNVKGCKKLSK
jgi:hypothetical protein